jgi:hypothetical protein
MNFLGRIKEDVYNDLLTSDYPSLKERLKKIIYEDENKELIIFQKYFGMNQYNKDLSEIYLIDYTNNKKQLNYYLFSDNIVQIKMYNNYIILIDIEGDKRIFKQNYYLKYFYISNTLKKIYNSNTNFLDCYYKEINIQ